MNPDVTLVIPTIPPRRDRLIEAVRSGLEQTHPPSMIIVANDVNGEGAPATRTRGLQHVGTEWTAFLDSDDVMYAEHLRTLMAIT